jgi:hypothetical protein
LLFFDVFTFYALPGPLDSNGYECPASCPMNCPMIKDGMMNCPGGDDGNGCEMPEFCISSFGKFESNFSFCTYPHALEIIKFKVNLAKMVMHVQYHAHKNVVLRKCLVGAERITMTVPCLISVFQ